MASTARLVAEEEIPPTPQPQFQEEPLFRPPTLQQILAVLAALAQIVGQRLGMLLFGSGSFVLAWRALDAPAGPTPNAIWTLVVFSLLVFIPTVVLNGRRNIVNQ